MLSEQEVGEPRTHRQGPELHSTLGWALPANQESRMVEGSQTPSPTLLLQKTFFQVAAEEDIFRHLGLAYLPPEQRNA